MAAGNCTILGIKTLLLLYIVCDNARLIIIVDCVLVIIIIEFIIKLCGYDYEYAFV